MGDENKSRDEFVEKLEKHFIRLRDKCKEYSMGKLVKLLMGDGLIDGLGHDDDKLDVFYASFIINVIENFVSSENDRELLFALNGFLEGYDTMSVGKRYETYMNYAPSYDNRIKSYWKSPGKHFHNAEEPIVKTLANRLYGDISRDNRKKLKAIANQVIKELNESPGGFPKSPKLRTIRELPQIQDNNTEENPLLTNEVGKEDAKNCKEASSAGSKEDTAAEIISSFSDEGISNNDSVHNCLPDDNNRSNDMICSGFVVDPKNKPNVISLSIKQTIANTEKIKAYIFAAAAVMVILAGVAIFFATKAQREVTLPDDLEWGWGDNGGLRSDYTTLQIERGALGNKIVFNSISDGGENGGFSGHEKNFVSARDSAAEIDGVWRANNIVVENNHIYTIRAYICNNNPNENNVAENTKICFSIPMGDAKVVQVNGIFESSNAEPSEYWDSINFICGDENAFHLEYVYGSAMLWNDGIGKGGLSLGDEIVTEATKGGVLIGYDALDGRVPGGYEYHNYVSICVKAVFAPEYIR